MIKLTFDTYRFQLELFLQHLADFYELQQLSEAAVVRFFGYDEPSEWISEITPQECAEKLRNGEMLYFPFSDFNIGVPVACADGGAYDLPVVEEDESEMAFCATELESLGYIIQMNAEQVTVHAAVLVGGELSLIEDTPVFDANPLAEPMEQYIRQFVG